MSRTNQIWAYCRSCENKTKHDVLGSAIEHGIPEEGLCIRTFHLAQCAGCETHSYCTSTETEDSWNPHTEEMEPTWEIYPTEEGALNPIDEYYRLPTRIRNSYRETVESINSDLLLLPAVGLRMSIEAICKDKNVQAKNLSLKIEELASRGVITKEQTSVLHSLRFMGNTVVHDMDVPSRDEVLAALEIVEVMLRVIYRLPELSRKIVTGSRN